MVSKPKSIKRAIAAFALALAASLALGAGAAGSASAAVQQWYSCQNVGATKGTYEDAACSKEGGTKAFAWKKLAWGAPKGFTMKATTGFTMKWTLSGFPFAVNCSSQSGKGEGTIENPANKILAGVAKVGPSQFTGCTVSEPKGYGCQIDHLTLYGLGGEATEVEGKPAVKFSPSAGTIAEPTFYDCSQSGFNTTYYIKGYFTGIANNATSSLEFTKAGSSIGPGGGGAFEGTSKIESTTGEALKLAP
jgi:hypothetical protein